MANPGAATGLLRVTPGMTCSCRNLRSVTLLNADSERHGQGQTCSLLAGRTNFPTISENPSVPHSIPLCAWRETSGSENATALLWTHIE